MARNGRNFEWCRSLIQQTAIYALIFINDLHVRSPRTIVDATPRLGGDFIHLSGVSGDGAIPSIHCSQRLCMVTSEPVEGLVEAVRAAQPLPYFLDTSLPLVVGNSREQVLVPLQFVSDGIFDGRRTRTLQRPLLGW